MYQDDLSWKKSHVPVSSWQRLESCSIHQTSTLLLPISWTVRALCNLLCSLTSSALTLLVHRSRPSEENLLPRLGRGLESRDCICFCFLQPACWFGLFGKGAALEVALVVLLFFPRELGAVKRAWLSVLTLDSGVGWRHFRGLLGRCKLRVAIAWFSQTSVSIESLQSILLSFLKLLPAKIWQGLS